MDYGKSLEYVSFNIIFHENAINVDYSLQPSLKAYITISVMYNTHTVIEPLLFLP